MQLPFQAPLNTRHLQLINNKFVWKRPWWQSELLRISSVSGVIQPLEDRPTCFFYGYGKIKARLRPRSCGARACFVKGVRSPHLPPSDRPRQNWELAACARGEGMASAGIRGMLWRPTWGDWISLLLALCRIFIVKHVWGIQRHVHVRVPSAWGARGRYRHLSLTAPASAAAALVW